MSHALQPVSQLVVGCVLHGDALLLGNWPQYVVLLLGLDCAAQGHPLFLGLAGRCLSCGPAQAGRKEGRKFQKELLCCLVGYRVCITFLLALCHSTLPTMAVSCQYQLTSSTAKMHAAVPVMGVLGSCTVVRCSSSSYSAPCLPAAVPSSGGICTARLWLRCTVNLRPFALHVSVCMHVSVTVCLALPCQHCCVGWCCNVC